MKALRRALTKFQREDAQQTLSIQPNKAISYTDIEKLLIRISQTLNWSLKDVKSMSFRSLRKHVQPISPKLSHELTVLIDHLRYRPSEEQ